MPANLPLSRRAALVGALTGAAVFVAGRSFAAGIVDPLLRPALKTPRAVRALLMGVARAGRRLVAVGEHGVVILSDDEGANWRQAAAPVSVTLTAAHFPTPSHGWAVGHDGVVLRSVDGGENWIKQFDGHDANRLIQADADARIKALQAGADPADADAAADAAAVIADDAQAAVEFGPSRPLLAVWFRDERNGYVAGSYGQIFQTRDGGGSWRSLATRIDNPEGLHYSAVVPTAGGGVLLAGESGRVWLSRDEGASWRTAVAAAQTPLYGAVATDDGGLLVFGFGGRIFRSDDGGRSWGKLNSPANRTLVAATRFNDGALALADAGGGVIVSRDGGRSFIPVRPPGLVPVAGAAALSGGVLLVGGGGARTIALTQRN